MAGQHEAERFWWWLSGSGISVGGGGGNGARGIGLYEPGQRQQQRSRVVYTTINLCEQAVNWRQWCFADDRERVDARRSRSISQVGGMREG